MSGPQVLATIAAVRNVVGVLRSEGQTLGAVPTMGALHEGHLSLVREAQRHNSRTLTTIFVNPTQFGPHEDFGRYPRTVAADLELLGQIGCDYVFAPDAAEIYPPGSSTSINPPALSLPLEGGFRPGHFQGVATIVLKLLNIVQPDVAYFGQKDFQQAAVIRQMVKDLDVPVHIEVCPIVREADGLAMSSRNRYLAPDERARAVAIHQALQVATRLYQSGERSLNVFQEQMRDVLRAAGFGPIDYATVADRQTLTEPTQIDSPSVALIAAYLGKTRLIDNCLLGP